MTTNEALERLPYAWNHLIEKESLKFKEWEHVKREKACQFFRDMLKPTAMPVDQFIKGGN